MIESLDGIFETVNYKKSTTLKLYDNIEYEDYPMHWHPAIEIVMPVENDCILQILRSIYGRAISASSARAVFIRSRHRKQDGGLSFSRIRLICDLCAISMC